MFTEGEKTEYSYLLPWRRQYRDSVLITIDPFHGTPRSLVDRAVETKRAESRDERRGRGRAHDEIWCVFDIDEHPNNPDAIQKAEAHGIQLAISNPCIELWFILHFEGITPLTWTGTWPSRGRQRSCSVERHTTPEAMGHPLRRIRPRDDRALSLDRKHAGDDSPVRGYQARSVGSSSSRSERDHSPMRTALARSCELTCRLDHRSHGEVI
ncbi:MAG: RloB domain-containing protein [Candidatus Microthrix sp.]|nr:RloB domain-containing protein [Candidatus Microthrix sp.]